MSNLFTKLHTTEAAKRMLDGREKLQADLAQSPTRGGADNTVVFTGPFETAAGDFDQFTVHVASGTEVSKADRARFEALGCEVRRTDGRIAVLQYPHASYDTRWVKIDMSAPQCWLMAFVVVLALGLAAAALIV